jgi:hypothetical protein
MPIMQDVRFALQQQAITILSELIKKDNHGVYLGHTNFDPKRDAEKAVKFVTTYVSEMAKDF